MEILEFTINSLRELESELDRLSSSLATVTKEQGKTTKALRERLTKIEQKAVELEKKTEQLKNIILSSSVKNASKQEQEKTDTSPLNVSYGAGESVTLSCKQWEDFQACAYQAQVVTFEGRDNKRFRVSALKNNQIITYEGESLSLPNLLKAWLSEQLKIVNDTGNTIVIEGSII